MNHRDFNHFAWILFLPLLVLSGCENGSPKPASIGDHAVLEQLAESYRSVAQQYPVQPASMRSAGKKKFVKEVFEKAGYSFSATLKAFARQGVDVTNQKHRDLAELLFLPHKGLAETELATLYSSDELVAIKAIQISLK
jgi:hypothetical protein